MKLTVFLQDNVFAASAYLLHSFKEMLMLGTGRQGPLNQMWHGSWTRACAPFTVLSNHVILMQKLANLNKGCM
jgi:hypothetical protein